MARARKQPKGLEKPTIEVDGPLSRILPGTTPGERISAITVTQSISRYVRREGLKVNGWEIRLDGPLAEVTGLPQGHAADRRVVISRVWSYIKGHGLQKGNPDSEIDRAFDEAKREVKRKVKKGEIKWGAGWGLLLGGAVVLALLWLAGRQREGGAAPPSGGAGGGQAPSGGGGGGGGQPICPADSVYDSTDGLCHPLNGGQPFPPSTGGSGQGQGGLETIEPTELGTCPSGYYFGTDGLCHKLG